MRVIAVVLAATGLLAKSVLATPDPYQPSSIPETVFAKVVRAREVRLSGNPGLAARELEGVVQAHPDYFLGRYNLGLAYAALRRTDEAIAELTAAKQLNTSFKLGEPTIYVSLGALHLEAQRYVEALAELRVATDPPVFKALDANSRTVALNNLGYAYSRLKRSCEADLVYELASSVPDNPSKKSTSQFAGLAGHWVVQEWIVVDEGALTSGRALFVTGTLTIEPRQADGSFSGDLSLCVGRGSHGSSGSFRGVSPTSVRERMRISLSEDGAEMLMLGRVTSGRAVWSDDRIVGRLLGDAIEGTVRGRWRDRSDRLVREKHRVRFVRLW